jgi:hypothetical protein
MTWKDENENEKMGIALISFILGIIVGTTIWWAGYILYLKGG